MRSTLLKAVALFSPIALVQAAVYKPDNSCATCSGLAALPVPYNLSTSQTNSIENGATNSFWISSFVTGSNGHQYFIIGHAMEGTGLGASYRASILDITNPSFRVQFSQAATANTSFYSATGVFNFTTSNFTFASTSATDGLSKMRVWANYNDVRYDLTFATSSPVLLNGGTGSFEVAGGVGYEWSIPAAKTTGSLTVNGRTITVDTASSLTWYDREWGNVGQSWYWFEIHVDPMAHLPNGAVLSLWCWADTISGNKNFATVRDDAGTQSVVAVTKFTPDMSSKWTSPDTNLTFVQDFEVELADGTSFSISSLIDDQVLWDESNPALGGGYEGYMTVTGTYKGVRGARGFAVSEQLANSYTAYA
jgi:hypothetical protein